MGREKLKQYAPVATAVAQTAKDRAGNFAMHSRLATHTGIHMAGVISFCLALLAACIILPVALGWPLTLTVTQRTDSKLLVDSSNVASPSASPDAPEQNSSDEGNQVRNDYPQGYPVPGTASQANQAASPQETELTGMKTYASSGIQGSLDGVTACLSGFWREITFVPKELTDVRKTQFSGGLMADRSLQRNCGDTKRRGNTEDGTGKGALALLEQPPLFWFSALALLLILIIPMCQCRHLCNQKILFSCRLSGSSTACCWAGCKSYMRKWSTSSSPTSA